MCKYLKHCKYCRCLKIFLLVFISRCKRKIHQTVWEAWCKHILSIWLRWHHILCVHWFFSHWKWNRSQGSDEKRLSEWGETTSRAALLSGRWVFVDDGYDDGNDDEDCLMALAQIFEVKTGEFHLAPTQPHWLLGWRCVGVVWGGGPTVD